MFRWFLRAGILGVAFRRFFFIVDYSPRERAVRIIILDGEARDNVAYIICCVWITWLSDQG